MLLLVVEQLRHLHPSHHRVTMVMQQHSMVCNSNRRNNNSKVRHQQQQQPCHPMPINLPYTIKWLQRQWYINLLTINNNNSNQWACRCSSSNNNSSKFKRQTIALLNLHQLPILTSSPLTTTKSNNNPKKQTIPNQHPFQSYNKESGQLTTTSNLDWCSTTTKKQESVYGILHPRTSHESSWRTIHLKCSILGHLILVWREH
mmetsp:Transcript_30585/g.47897  ORF Transcript_30585/g.47897 Transcript_30585/m.47897 type:complete len:202 (-) Transcript_30585:1157-1762(-)